VCGGRKGTAGMSDPRASGGWHCCADTAAPVTGGRATKHSSHCLPSRLLLVLASLAAQWQKWLQFGCVGETYWIGFPWLVSQQGCVLLEQPVATDHAVPTVCVTCSGLEQKQNSLACVPCNAEPEARRVVY
jgi:hypothetical protein